ncbi:hypothetical protein NliqN6_6656 [Naganishia liquefaciens]|uniref:LisH domain-containing protein n=1 Tax=Naganishia liquefaciens TaxID=104408 RepID=A0A8H3U028_9TREE|nr:hypothetical protein NliqN6_6656 [Naganishia liquefaciens]
MSSPPHTDQQPFTRASTSQPPLFISYVTGSRAGGQWTTRVSRPVIDLEPSIVVERSGGEHSQEAASRREGGLADRRRVVLPLPTTTHGERVEESTRSGESVQVRDAGQTTMPKDAVDKMVDFKCTANGSFTLRRLWNNAQAAPGTNSVDNRQSGEQLLKGIIVDYLTHERFPNTVRTLLGHGRHGELAERSKGKGREEVEGEDDVMMSSMTLPRRSMDQKTRTHVEMLVLQIERRKEIRELLESGRISVATDLIRRHFPTLLDTSRDTTDEHIDEEDDEMDTDEESASVERYTLSQNISGKRKPSTDTAPSLATNSRQFPSVTGFATGPSGNAARGGAGSRFGMLTAPNLGNGTTTTTTTTAGPSGDVQWTAHPRSSGSLGGSVPAAVIDDAPPPVPDFPYARTYDRPTLLALNLDIQEFVEGLRILQQQGPSSPSEATSLSNSLYEDTSNGHTADQSTTTPPPDASAIRKATRDAAILACLAHAARLDAAAHRLRRPREARRYAQQVQDVCGLLAYTDMEASPLAGYLEQGRRVRLAEMVEGCIMASIGYPPQSILETLWQQNAYVWHSEIGHLAVNDIKLENEDVEGDEGKKMRELAMDLLYDEPLRLP